VSNNFDFLLNLLKIIFRVIVNIRDFSINYDFFESFIDNFITHLHI